MKTLLLLVATLSLTLAVCPWYCKCTGFNPNICTLCNDPHKTIASNCKNCQANYTKNYLGQCVWSVQWCPEGCICNGFVPGCAQCKLPNFSPSTNCTQCATGYYLWTSNMYGTKECRPQCLPRCDCSVPGTCTACKDNLANPATNCLTCNPPYHMNPATGHCAI